MSLILILLYTTDNFNLVVYGKNMLVWSLSTNIRKLINVAKKFMNIFP